MTDGVATQIAEFIVEEIMDGECDMDLHTQENLLLTGVLDSLGVMRLVAWIGDHYAVTVPPEDIKIENFQNLDAMVAYIESNR